MHKVMIRKIPPENWAKVFTSVKQILFNILVVSFPSLILLLILCELVIFRFIIPVTQPPLRSFDKKWSLVKFAPNQSGISRKGLMNQTKVRYRMNSDGWNSARDYSESRGEAIRIAVIGDSYVEGFAWVDFDTAFHAIVEKDLSEKGYKVEAYSFGIAGAPLSQYLHMMRYSYQKFRPDIAIVNIIYNDFDESLYHVGLKKYGTGNNHFFTFKQIPTNNFVSVPPDEPTSSRIRRILRKSVLMRFLYFQIELPHRIARLRSAFTKREKVEGNIFFLRALKLEKSIIEVTRHIFTEYKQLSDRYEVKLLLVIDAPRQYIYRNENPREAKVYRFNEIALKLASEIGIEIIDLTDNFVNDYKTNQHRFDFTNDGHWNERGHRVVGQTISRFLVEQGWLK